MNRRFRILVLLVAVSVSGCAPRVKNVTDLPPGVTLTQVQRWDRAVTDLSTIASLTSAARKTAIELNMAGDFPAGPPYRTTLEAIANVDTLQLAASSVLKETPNQFTDTTRSRVKEMMDQISAQIVLLNATGGIGIKNKDNQMKFQKLLGQIQAAADLVLSL